MFWASTCLRSATIIGIVGAGGIGLRQAEQVRELERQKVSFPILMNLVAVLVQPSAAIALSM
jgi:ABC-type phosphate/phosphonate transport system permease subunit